VDILSHLSTEIDLSAAEVDAACNGSCDGPTQRHTDEIALDGACHVKILAEDEQRALNVLIGRDGAGGALQEIAGLDHSETAPKKQHGQNQQESCAMHKALPPGFAAIGLIIGVCAAMNHLRE
jgi:hypothetical protein